MNRFTSLFFRVKENQSGLGIYATSSLCKIAVLLLAFIVMTMTSYSVYARMLNDDFDRPLSCPLRSSGLTDLRDKMQTLVNSLAKTCTESSQNELNQALNNIVGLESIATSWQVYNTDNPMLIQTQFARNVNLILRNLNSITSNNSCFNDVRSRGALPVIGDVITALSQFGLLFPNVPGMLAASGGVIVGTGLKIVHKLISKKFNWNRPEERRLFLKLNCAFFENRILMEELGVFNPETKSFRQEIEKKLIKKMLEFNEDAQRLRDEISTKESHLDESFQKIPEIKKMNIDFSSFRKAKKISQILMIKPTSTIEKNQQIFELTKYLDDLNSLDETIMTPSLEKKKEVFLNYWRDLQDHIVDSSSAIWQISLADYDKKFRAPLLSASTFINDIEKLKNKYSLIIFQSDDELGTQIKNDESELKKKNNDLLVLKQRMMSLNNRISSLENKIEGEIFSSRDEGQTAQLEILENYRLLQSEILGSLGKGYLKNAATRASALHSALKRQIDFIIEKDFFKKRDFINLLERKEYCSVAEKTLFMWSQYMAQVQESYDFVMTNVDLYRSSFKVGKEKVKRAQIFVLRQMESVIDHEKVLDPDHVGYYIKHIADKTQEIEGLLEKTGCF